eukprot:534406-Hanusia_phi.AAC.2
MPPCMSDVWGWVGTPVTGLVLHEESYRARTPPGRRHLYARVVRRARMYVAPGSDRGLHPHCRDHLTAIGSLSNVPSTRSYLIDCSRAWDVPRAWHEVPRTLGLAQ